MTMENPFQDIADALAREIRETDSLKFRLVEASKTESSLRVRVTELERGEQVWQNLHNALELTASDRDRYRVALEFILPSLDGMPTLEGAAYDALYPNNPKR
jgi:hypothetical protein